MFNSKYRVVEYPNNTTLYKYMPQKKYWWSPFYVDLMLYGAHTLRYAEEVCREERDKSTVYHNVSD